MPAQRDNAQVAHANVGWLVSRAAAVVPAVALSPQTIFTVAGGRVLVRYMTGEVTTVFDGTVYTLKATFAPTLGAATDWTTALTMTSFAVGVHVAAPATVGGAFTHDSTARAALVMPLFAGGILVPAGAITLTGSATQTGAMKWDLGYVSLDPGASVMAA